MLKLLIAGEGSERYLLEKYVKENNLPNGINLFLDLDVEVKTVEAKKEEVKEEKKE